VPTRSASALDHPPTIEQAVDLSRHLIRAQEEERKRISRELHDDTGQGLMLLKLYLGMVANSSENPESYLKVQEALGLLDRTIGDLRRIIARLSPRILEEMGLLAAIRNEARELGKHSGIKTQLELPKSLAGVNHETEIAVYRSVQEALHNVAKHAKAKNLLIRLEVDADSAHLWVEDDGMGFSSSGGSSARSFGILGMRERIAALGGNVRIRSRKGRGTRLRVTLPIAQAGARKKQAKVERRASSRVRAIDTAPPKGKRASLVMVRDLLKGNSQSPHVH
jgi:two-component system, NarL family, sensor histidine kinase UhpB